MKKLQSLYSSFEKWFENRFGWAFTNGRKEVQNRCREYNKKCIGTNNCPNGCMIDYINGTNYH